MTIETEPATPGKGTPMGTNPSPSIPVATMVALALVGMLGPLGTDAALPALPAIAVDLGVSEPSVRLILSAYTIGLAGGQLVIGALSDRLGRRRLMNWGALAAAVAAFAASTSQTLLALIIACAVLGIASAAGLVTGRAFISDSSVGRQAARRFTILQLSISFGPIVGPLAGAALLTVGDWRTIFLSLASLAIIGTLATMLFVPESLPTERRGRQTLGGYTRTMGRILGTPQFLAFAASMWLGFGTLFAYISASSSIFQTEFRVSSGAFALAFAVNGAGLLLVSLLAATIVHKVSPARLVLVGLGIQLSALLALGVSLLSGVAVLPIVVIGLFVSAASLGLVLGPATSLAVAPVREQAGTALALLGSLQFVAAAVTSTLTAVIDADPLTAFVLVGSTSTVLALSAAIVGARVIPDRPTRSSTA